MVTDQTLIDDLITFADECGTTPTKRQMQDDGPWSSSTYTLHFESWNNALEEAGLQKNADVSSEALIADLQAFADEVSGTPTVGQMSRDGPWSPTTYQNQFGSWNNALEEAGLRKNTGVEPEQLLTELQEYADEVGETPTAGQMRDDGPRSPVTYQMHFGSWNNALKEAGLEQNYVTVTDD